MVVLSGGDWVGELQLILRHRGIDTSAVQNPLLAIQVASSTPSAVLVLDVAPHNAVEAVQRAQSLRPQTKVIAVSDSRPELDTALALIGNVDYFLLFPSQNIPMLARVIERNENVFTAAGFRVDASLRTAEYGGTPLDLSPVEFQVLLVMVQAYNGHQRITYQDLAREIYKEELTDTPLRVLSGSCPMTSLSFWRKLCKCVLSRMMASLSYWARPR